MIGYITLGTNDLSRATAYYDTLFETIGAKRLWTIDRGVAWGKEKGPRETLNKSPGVALQVKS
jgi:hypothetical protein